MNDLITTWAARWGVPSEALADLSARLGAATDAPAAGAGLSEAAVQSRVRVAASKLGWRVFRNNVGAYHDAARGVHVRFGLANDSHQMNAVVKSADLIGIKPVLVTPAHVGQRIGQFVSLECKRAGWRYSGDPHERAQEAWAALVLSMGGDARFVTGDDLERR